MSTQFKLTEEDKEMVMDAIRIGNQWLIIEGIVASRLPEAPRWISITERMPTADDGNEDGYVIWMVDVVGLMWAAGYSPPPGSIAWHPLAQWIKPPPAPTPEDPVRVAFEKWATTELSYALNRYVEGPYVFDPVRCAWAAWQAARADAGTPEPVDANEALVDESAWQDLMAKAGTPELGEPSQEDIAWEEFRAWYEKRFGVPANPRSRQHPVFMAFVAGKAKGGQPL